MAAIWARATLRRCAEVLRSDSSIMVPIELTRSRLTGDVGGDNLSKPTNCAARSARTFAMMPQNSPPKARSSSAARRARRQAERLLGGDIPARSGTLGASAQRPSPVEGARAARRDGRGRAHNAPRDGRGAAPQRVARAPTRRGPTEEEWAEMMADSERVVVSMPTFRGPGGRSGCSGYRRPSPTSSSRGSQRGGPDAVAAAGRRGSIPTKALQVPCSPATPSRPHRPRSPLPRAAASQMLGATIDDVRIEKALLVMGRRPADASPAAPRPPSPKRAAPPRSCRRGGGGGAAVGGRRALHLAGHGDLSACVGAGPLSL